MTVTDDQSVVISLWRYPVMGLAGESLKSVTIGKTGIEGDHAFFLYDQVTRKVMDPVRYRYSWGETEAAPSMLDLSASYSPEDSSALIVSLPNGAGISSKDRNINRMLSSVLPNKVELVQSTFVMEDKARRGRGIHLITTATLARFKQLYPGGDFDVRRFRPNMVVDTIQQSLGFVEQEWVGKSIQVGEQVILKVEAGNKRCSLTTLKQGGLPDDSKILRTISNYNHNVLGVICSVASTGVVKVGDSVSSIIHDDRKFNA